MPNFFFKMSSLLDPNELSRRKRVALQQFRDAVQDIPNKPATDDRYYLRWLRARQFKVRKAVDLFIKVSLEIKLTIQYSYMVFWVYLAQYLVAKN